MAIDPICKMDVDPKTVKHKSTFNDKVFYFCCRACKEEFDKNPKKYVG
jgi:YHS domain-containing protein